MSRFAATQILFHLEISRSTPLAGTKKRFLQGEGGGSPPFFSVLRIRVSARPAVGCRQREREREGKRDDEGRAAVEERWVLDEPSQKGLLRSREERRWLEPQRRTRGRRWGRQPLRQPRQHGELYEELAGSSGEDAGAGHLATVTPGRWRNCPL